MRVYDLTAKQSCIYRNCRSAEIQNLPNESIHLSKLIDEVKYLIVQFKQK